MNSSEDTSPALPGWTASPGPLYLDPSILHSQEGEKRTNVVWLSDFAYLCIEQASSKRQKQD